MASQYISFTRAFRRLGVSAKTMRRIASRERLVIRQLPGLNRVEYRLEDIERIERESFRVAGSPSTAGNAAAQPAGSSPAMAV